jgi:GTP-binding protein
VSKPLVAIVGAPNVGKSTLFNRLVGGRRAIVTDQAGVTRDRLYGEVDSVPNPFRIVDTGGLTPGTSAPFAREIETQVDLALREAAMVLLVVDARSGLTAHDLDLVGRLRKDWEGPLLLVANKIDGPSVDALVHDLHGLGLGQPIAVSAEHGRGIEELLASIAAGLQPSERAGEPPDEQPRALEVAIVGRPNVGKSSLLNRLLGEERAVVSERPGTTRDAIDSLLVLDDDRRFVLIDTAGMRRRGKLREVVERRSVQRAHQNIERSDVTVLVLDASEELAAQDAHIAGFILDSHKPMIVAVNKWDLIEGREAEAKRWEDRVRTRLRFFKQVPMVLVSAKTGQRVTRILDLAEAVWAEGGRWIPTSELNRWIEEVGGGSGPATRRGFRIYYGTQTGVHPPRFLLFCNDTQRIHFSVRRHLENSLRRRFELGGSPLRMVFRPRRSAKGG